MKVGLWAALRKWKATCVPKHNAWGRVGTWTITYHVRAVHVLVDSSNTRDPLLTLGSSTFYLQITSKSWSTCFQREYQHSSSRTQLSLYRHPRARLHLPTCKLRYMA